MPGFQHPVSRTGAWVTGGGIAAGSTRHQTRRRHQKVLRDNIQGVTRPAIRRIARRGGVKRIKKEIYDTTRAVLRTKLEDILRNVVYIMGSAGAPKGTEANSGRKIVTTDDIVYALRQMGEPIYGYDWYPLVRPDLKKKKKLVRGGKD